MDTWRRRVVVINTSSQAPEVLARLTPEERSVIEVDPRFAGVWCDPV